MLNTAAERVETVRRWRELLADSVGKDPAAVKARGELERQLDEAYTDAVWARAKEDGVAGPREVRDA